MKRFLYSVITTVVLTVVMLILPSFLPPPPAVSYTSIANGNYSDASTWTPGGGGPALKDDVHIDGEDVTLDQHLTGGGYSGTMDIDAGFSLRGASYSVIIKSGGTLIVGGTLEVDDITFSNGSTILVEVGGEIIVNGDLVNDNNSDDVTINGFVHVKGDLTNGNSAEIGGTGSIQVDGSITNNGTIGGSMSDDLGTLPVELLSFKAAVDGDMVSINWETGSEINNQYFTVERSFNGVDFEQVARVNGFGNSNTPITYKAQDESPLEGNIYYRLRQTDYDGTEEVFDPISLYFERNGTAETVCEMGVNPNPCPGQCDVVLNNCENYDGQMIQLSVMDMNGNVVSTDVPSRGANGNVSYSIDTRNYLAPGIYVVSARSENESYTKKVVVE